MTAPGSIRLSVLTAPVPVPVPGTRVRIRGGAG